MDRSEASQRGVNTLAQLETQLDVLYGTPGFDADGLTDFYSDAILAPNYEPARERMNQWVELLAALQERPRYTVVVRGVPRVRKGERLEVEDAIMGRGLTQGWVRIFTDLTPDAFAFTQDQVETTMYDRETGVASVPRIWIRSPSVIFQEPGSSQLGLEVEPEALFDSAPMPGRSPRGFGTLAPVTGEKEEWQVKPRIFTTDSVEGIMESLDIVDRQEDMSNHQYWALCGGNNSFMDWSRQEDKAAAS